MVCTTLPNIAARIGTAAVATGSGENNAACEALAEYLERQGIMVTAGGNLTHIVDLLRVLNTSYVMTVGSNVGSGRNLVTLPTGNAHSRYGIVVTGVRVISGEDMEASEAVESGGMVTEVGSLQAEVGSDRCLPFSRDLDNELMLCAVLPALGAISIEASVACCNGHLCGAFGDFGVLFEGGWQARVVGMAAAAVGFGPAGKAEVRIVNLSRANLEALRDFFFGIAANPLNAGEMRELATAGFKFMPTMFSPGTETHRSVLLHLMVGLALSTAVDKATTNHSVSPQPLGPSLTPTAETSRLSITRNTPALRDQHWQSRNSGLQSTLQSTELLPSTWQL